MATEIANKFIAVYSDEIKNGELNTENMGECLHEWMSCNRRDEMESFDEIETKIAEKL